jgi:hypothetical protein
MARASGLPDVRPTDDGEVTMWQDNSVPKRSSRTKDVNQLAKSIVDQLIGDKAADAPAPTPESVAHAAAVALGRLGGLKGGKARAAKLSKKKRAEIAKKAAKARWRSG